MEKSGLFRYLFSLIVTDEFYPDIVAVESATEGFPQILPDVTSGVRFSPHRRDPFLVFPTVPSGPHAY